MKFKSTLKDAIINTVQSLTHVHLFGPYRLQHIKLLCPSVYFEVCSNSYPVSQRGHPTISSSAVPSSLALNLSHHQGPFQWVSSSYQVARVLELQLQHQSFQWIFSVRFLIGLTPCCSGDSSPAPQFESINSSALSFWTVQLSHLYMTTGKP